jgi:streptomycin 6-kinase
MRGETVAQGFRAFVTRLYGDEGRAWIAGLSAVLDELASRWRLELGPELPGSLLACVRTARRADGTDAVLKVSAWHRTNQEIAALRVWAGRGAPTLLEADEALRALLLERIEPGAHPSEAHAGDIAAVLHELHVHPTFDLPTLAETVRKRIDSASREGRASQQKATWAHAKAAELDREAPPPVLLHGDFDERNLLVCDRRRLCAIDPLPCAGDPAYDAAYWVHGNRAPGRRARLDAIVAATGLDRARVRDWAAIVGVHG